jgi:dipeptidase E
MRLYLSSFRVGNHPSKLHELIGRPKARLAIVMNATDLDSEAEIDQKYQEEVDRFQRFDYRLERLDLRDYFGMADDLEKKMQSYDCLWVRGGNTFVLRRAMKESGLDEIILNLVKNDALVYAGYSAGVVILQHSLKGLDIVDDPIAAPKGYSKDTPWGGLGLLPYNVAVHYKSGHFESSMVDKEIAYMKKHKLPFKTLKDGEVIIINGDKEELLK